MPGISHIPFPSFTLVLTSERVIVPGPSLVRFAPVYRATNGLMTTVQPQEKDIEEPVFLTTFPNDTVSAIIHGDTETEARVPEQELEVEKVVGKEEKLSSLSFQKRAAIHFSRIVRWIFQSTLQ